MIYIQSVLKARSWSNTWSRSARRCATRESSKQSPVWSAGNYYLTLACTGPQRPLATPLPSHLSTYSFYILLQDAGETETFGIYRAGWGLQLRPTSLLTVHGSKSRGKLRPFSNSQFWSFFLFRLMMTCPKSNATSFELYRTTHLQQVCSLLYQYYTS